MRPERSALGVNKIYNKPFVISKKK